MTRPAAAPLARTLPLYLLIAALPFCDFLQTGIVAFNAAPVMGGIGASPEEYSGVATLYGVVAIGTIAMHRRLVERLGWRRLLLAASALFALGAVVCGFAGGLLQFGLGRSLMALGCASFMTAGRVLVNRIPPSPRRFTGIRFFAAGLAWGIAAGPLLASLALAGSGWRAAFLLLPLPALLLALLAAWQLDDRRSTGLEALAPSQPIALLVLMGGSFLLLHGLQRSGFDFFADGRPLIRIADLAQRRYLAGLAVFGLCYLLLGANNLVLPVLLQRAMGLPLELAGRFLGLGALAGVASWIVLARLLPRSPGPTRYYLAGFGALLLSGWQLSHLSESADPLRSVLPALLGNGAFVIVTLATTAMQAFQALQRDERVFSHANQVKNMLAQFGIAAGTALATLCMQWRSTVRFERLNESLSPSNPALAPALEQLTRHFAVLRNPAEAAQFAAAQLGQQVMQEATWMAALDYFRVVTLIAATCLALVMVERLVRKGPTSGR
jgi:MFS family permease